MIFLPLVAILGYSFAISRRLRWPVEVALFSVVCSLMVWLFAAALVGLLEVAAWALLCGGLVLLATEGWHGRARRWITPGLFAVIAVTLLHWIRLRGASTWSWDDFSHWMLQGKVIALSHALPAKDDPVVFKDYPAGAALFRYFMNLGSSFNEGHAITAQGLITLAAIGTVLQDAKWSQWPGALALFVIGYLSVYLLGDGFNTVLVDQALGSVFGATLAVYFLAPADRASSVWRAAAGIAALPLLKPIGFHLAVLATAIILLDQMIRWAAIRKFRVQLSPEDHRSYKRHLAVAGLIVTLPFITLAGWQHYAGQVQDRPTFDGRPSASQVFRIFSPQATDRDRATIGAFASAFSNESATIIDQLPNLQAIIDSSPALQRLKLATTNPPQLVPIPTMQWVIILALAGVGICMVQSTGMRMRSLSLQFCLVFGFGFYAFGHLLVYLFAFSEHEGRTVASFGRYMRTYFLGWSIVLSALIALACRDGTWRRPLQIATVIMSLMALAFLPSRAMKLLLEPAPPMIPQRAELQAPLELIKRHVAAGTRVYAVFQNTNGFELWITKYELAPVGSNVDCWSIGRPYGAGDVWTCDLTATELRKRLLGYDYLYLGRVDERFWERFAEAFPGVALSRNALLFELQTMPDGERRPVTVLRFDG